ncbi:MAG TPA: hypothetical protein PLS03_14875 [Terrimicrobiaceae bacterium]|nr:hypothetical protein [Terrimicrobiaceae bacterium]
MMPKPSLTLLPPLGWIVVTVLWLAAIVAGMGVMLNYSQTPGGSAGRAPEHWPATSSIPRGGDCPTLVMFAHPKCPCTRASISELNVLLSRCPQKVAVRVVFFEPEMAGDQWVRTDLWDAAAAIPGVSVEVDEGGKNAENFRATTSGHVVLYDAGGQLLFSGGITEARGHSGDNAGRSTVLEILRGGSVSSSETPTFGCSLQDQPAGPIARQDS